MTYNVVLHREAKKDIKKLHPQIRSRVIEALEEIAENPRLHGAIMLTGYIVLVKPKWTRLIDNFHAQPESYHH